ncbi:hypothetical protein AURDEDRAFT_162438 [Auricularia subglabra TFB-10046 SS5]|nr:hypothetical protein AURDEDRAFT_162438 [Auricularia subglabra TFB-10046 SS5]
MPPDSDADSELQTPRVNGKPTRLHRLSYAELAKSPLLASLVSLINKAYAATHGPPYLPANPRRLRGDADLLQELAPRTTLYVLTLEDRTMGVIMYEECELPGVSDRRSEPTAIDATKRPQLEGGRDEYQCIVRFFNVNPSLHRRGIGSWLAGMLEDDVKRTARSLEGVSTVRLALATAGEVNGDYYTRHGWRTTRRTRIPAGCLGSPEGFTALWMDKVLPLDT